MQDATDVPFITHGDLLPNVSVEVETAAQEVLKIANAPEMEVNEVVEFYNVVNEGRSINKLDDKLISGNAKPYA